VLLKNFKNCNK